MKIIFALLSYFLGTISPGFFLFHMTDRKDIRKIGSGGTGATNVLRLKGWKFALPVLIVDIIKGALPVYLALLIFENLTFASLCAFLVVLGHCFPFYLKFRGGKGIATTVGVYSVLALKPLLLALSVFFLAVVFTRYVSLGSLFLTLSFPLLVYLLRGQREIIGLGILIMLLVAVRHHDNISRLIKGSERKIGERIQ